MQEVKFLLREIGENAMSAAELEEYIAYNLASKGFKLLQETPFPVMKDGKIKSVQVFMAFVKDEVSVVSSWNEDAKVPESETTVTDAPKKRPGRPAKVSA
jgi:dsDNA-binding SOS-regulon protein